MADPKTGESVTVDLGYDYREHKAVILAGIGPVLDMEDVITGKVRAFWDRQASRDYLDIDAIITTKKLSANELFAKLSKVRPEADAHAFADMLRCACNFADEYLAYGLSEHDIIMMCERLSSAAVALGAEADEQV